MSEHDATKSPAAPDDRELEAFLARQSPTSQAYHEALPPERVPDDVDAAVKAWAKREHDQHLGRRGRWWERAALPVGAAASLILVALLVNKGREAGVSEREAMHEATAGVAVSAARSAQAPVVENAKPSAAEPAAAPPSPRAPKATTPAAASRDLRSVAPRPQLPSQAVSDQASPPSEAQGSAAPAAAAAPAADNDAVLEARQPPAAADRSAAKSAAANVPAQRMAGLLSSAGSRAMKTEVAPPPPAAPPAIAAPAPAPFPAAQAPAQAVASESQLRSCDQLAPGTALDSHSYPLAESWLAGIRSLRDANQPEVARRQMRCWQRVYPQAAVPDDLKDLFSPP